MQEAQISYPTVQFGLDGFANIEKDIEQLVTVNHNKYLMSDKKIAFFGDTNKVMMLDIKKMEWQIKTITNTTIHSPGPQSPSQRLGGYNMVQPQNTTLDFMYYAAAVTMPNGDALITGGGSSTTVYQFDHAKCEIIQKASMN